MDIKKLINVKESFEVPNALLDILLSEKKDEFLENFKYCDLNIDFLRDVFQEEHSDRKNMMQDYTPDSVAKILSKVIKSGSKCIDMCAGTGSLTIQKWNENKDSTFICIEYSNRAIPFLLFNLLIRNMNAIVYHGDALSGKYEKVYQITKDEVYSNIEVIDNEDKILADICVTNPPYSMGWSPSDYQFVMDGYPLAPKSKADYAFILTALNQVNDSVGAILPHGVLFRGSSEGSIRKKLVENNMIDTIIGLPDKLFMNTDIPTVIMILNKNKNNNDVLFVDCSKMGQHIKNKNILGDEEVNKIIQFVKNRKELNKICHIASFEEIVSNDFNLNIPRYVDTFEEKAIPDIQSVTKEILEISKRMKIINQQLGIALDEMVGNTDIKSNELNILKNMCKELAK